MADLLTNLAAAAGQAGGDGAYIEDVFSTYLYNGNGTTLTITNGIDLAGEGGMVWIKPRSYAGSHNIYDTERGVGKRLASNLTSAEGTLNDGGFTAFNSDGFVVTGNAYDTNVSFETFASWTFRKAPKFFDCVTWTGNGVAGRTIAHNLGSVPGCIIVKRTDTTGDWQVYHRANTANPETDYLVLNSTAATADSNTRWNDTQPTDAVFSLGTEATVNASGGTYVAYLWAHDDGGFGDDGEQNVVSCGGYTGTGSAGLAVTLGYEPQWVLIKNSSGSPNDWFLYDNMRGLSVTSAAYLRPNLADAESTSASHIAPTSTGFTLTASGNPTNGSGTNYIYIAIRRGPMKTPEAGTEVYNAIARTGTGANATVTGVGFPPDITLIKSRSNARINITVDRLRGSSRLLYTSLNDGEGAFATYDVILDQMDGVRLGTASNINGSSPETYINWYFRRMPKCFDIVCYTGTGANRTVAHNLGVVPELMIVKIRSAIDDWAVYAGDNTDFLQLNTTAATADDNTYWNDTSPTSTVFSVGTNADVNTSAATYVAYLFASLAGVSDIGTYTGNGTSVSVTTGFQPRFILVKRTDSTGNWYVGDSARGLVAGDDPFLELNTSDAEVTNEDWVDVSGTGFTINETAANANVSTATYLYLAIS
jgi:hypothetical protein